jgi:YVTN family beta-propeller protein
MRFNFTLSSKKMAFVLSLAFTLFSVQATWAQKAYIPNLGDNTVSVIDLTTDMVTTIVDVGTAPLCVAISTATNKVYIGNRDSNNLSVINPTTDEVETTIDIGGNVRGIAVNSAGTKAYVGDLTNDALKVIDLSTSTIEATIPLNGDAIDVAISPDDTKVLVANGNELAIINTATNAVETNINMAFPYEIAFNPAGTKAYVVEVFGDRVLEVDIATNTSSTLLSGINGAEGISITPDGSTLYVAT